MDVFDLQSRISVDTAPYLAALQRAADETERLRRQMSAPITPFGGTPTTPSSTPSGGGGSGGGGGGLPSVTNNAEKAGAAIDELNKKLSDGFSAACKVGIAAFGTFSTAVIAGTKQAVEGFAQYEQLVGGVETLFKDSADTVKGYAESAYKTAGMSANQYMETVTAFSASLISSLEGDTEAAAEKANTAITDMADNSNKMGTSLESLSRAYMGFSRQNFTMLDNLALGFAGTKEGMQQLLDKAEELSGIKYDITQYSDIVDAIHVVQQEMGITGTTAKEAADTIEGSFNSTKAAIENLMVGFARSDADIDKLMGDVRENVSNLAKNVIPVAEKAFVGLAKAGIEAGKEIAEKLPKLIRQAMTDIHKMVADSFGESKTLIFGVETAVKSLTAAFITFKAAAYVADVVDSIKKVNDALKTGVTLTEALNKANLANPWVVAATAAVGFATALKSVIDIQTDLIDETLSSYEQMDEAQQEVYDSMNSILKGVSDSRKEWQNNNTALNDNAMTYAKLTEELFKLDEQEQLSNEDKAKMKAIVDELNGSVEGLNITLNEQNGHLKTQKKDIEAVIKAYNDQAKATATQERLVKLYEQQYKLEDNYKQAYKEHAEALRNYNIIKGKQIEAEKKFNEERKKWQDSNGTMNESKMNAAEEQLERLNKELETAETASAKFATTYSNIGSALRENQAEIDGNVQSLASIGQTVDETTATIINGGNATAGVLNAINQVVQQYDESTEGFWLNIRDNTRVLSIETAEKVGELIDTYDELYNAQYESIAKSVDLYKGFEADTSVTYQDLLSNLQQSEFYLNDWTTAIDQLQAKVDKGLMDQNFLDSLKDMGLDSWNIVYNMNHATEGQLKEYSDLWVKTNEEIKTSTDKLTEDQKEATEKKLSEITGIANASIEDYKQAFTNVGVAVGDGLAKGIQESVKEAKAAIKEAGEGVIQIGKETLKINSPSEEFREIGNYVVEGLIVGMAEKAYLAEETIRKVAQRIVKTAESELQISSPSKVMREIGGYVSEGFAEGIEDNEERVLEAASSMSESTISAMSKASNVNTEVLKSTARYSSDYDRPVIDTQELVTALKEGLKDLVSGDIIIEGTLDGEKLLEILFPKIDALQGKKAEAAIRGYAT